MTPVLTDTLDHNDSICEVNPLGKIPALEDGGGFVRLFVVGLAHCEIGQMLAHEPSKAVLQRLERDLRARVRGQPGTLAGGGAAL